MPLREQKFCFYIVAPTLTDRNSMLDKLPGMGTQNGKVWQ
jgi:hypothetical protein